MGTLAPQEQGGESQRAAAGAPGQLCLLIRRPEPCVSKATTDEDMKKGWKMSIKQNPNKRKQHKNIDIRQNS